MTARLSHSNGKNAAVIDRAYSWKGSNVSYER
jgi:hypothetical protein